ncbi:hypothetical protein BX600DRAFT_165002 [Xylariales sp. PMI_506]|nr:hypothetical protein BX600DRAFT_165002 [Xylariales sp. PMI_506]
MPTMSHYRHLRDRLRLLPTPPYYQTLNRITQHSRLGIGLSRRPICIPPLGPRPHTFSRPLPTERKATITIVTSQTFPPGDEYDIARLERGMTCPAFSNSVWGFAIYRCAKGNDDAWNQILHNIRDGVAKHLKEEQREDLLPYHDLHVIDDPAL